MINNSEFAERLKKIMDHHQLSAAAFADRIQVQRSSISHLLSGRNKPSLDFVMKVVREFKGVELYWLLNGKGSFPQEQQGTHTESKSISEDFPPVSQKEPERKPTKPSVSENRIERIVVFYSDGTFKAYSP
jgi:transcriptional regulator with XRE-family HTH domain